MNEKDPFEWPSIEGNVVNEFKTDGLATMAFPTLFPFGKGDPNHQGKTPWGHSQKHLSI